MSADNLVIVESPAKAKTIEKILGSQYTVKSSYGHIRDLEKKKMGIDIANDFAPNYIIAEGKEKVISELKKLAKKASTVWLATDEDREGEAISWHICEVLKLDPKLTKRIAFHEITKTAIQHAIQHPRRIDINLVNAQQARRILDRLVGFKLSPVLIQKVPSATSLSAGRVQSVAVRLIVERERAILKFVPDVFFKTIISLSAQDAKTHKTTTFTAEVKDFTTRQQVEAFLKECLKAKYVVDKIEVKQGSRTPAAPFTTSTLQQEAVRKLGYSVSRVMLIAQKLYEAGHITYMRTDSPTLSQLATEQIEKYVHSNYGKKYHKYRQFTSKNKSAQEAHEAIRPTDIERVTVPDKSHQALYDLIRKRTIASQMSSAQLEITTVSISISTSSEKCKAHGEVVVFDGFLKVYQEHKDEDSDTDDGNHFLPTLTEGQALDMLAISSKEKRTKPEARYNEATLVKKMEALGIGRPSTYAPTIATILKRGYVEKKSTEGEAISVAMLTLKDGKITATQESEKVGVEKNRIFPTELGTLVNNFLEQHFEKVMDYKFTAKIEEDFDKIAEGEAKWTETVGTFFKGFDETVKKVLKTAERVSGERELGKDPATGQVVKVRMGRYGPIVQLGESSESPQKATKQKKAKQTKQGKQVKQAKQDSAPTVKFVKLLPSQTISTITLEEALELLSLPKHLGMYQDQEMILKLGPFGPYIQHNKKFYSVPKEDKDIFAIAEPRAIQIIQEKNERDANRLIKDFAEEGIQILNGRFGVYIKTKDGNFKIPKDLQATAAELTLAKVQDLIANPPASPKRTFKRKK